MEEGNKFYWVSNYCYQARVRSRLSHSIERIYEASTVVAEVIVVRDWWVPFGHREWTLHGEPEGLGAGR